MSIYKNNFGFREPYQVLLDGTFCQVALAHKVNIQDQLPKYLSGQCKLLTTACIVEETKRLGKPLHGAYLIVSQFPIRDCGHEKPVSASKCLSSFIIDDNNKDHYIVATQDHRLRLKIARQTVCPLVKLANNALVLDKPTSKVLGKVNRTHHFLTNKISDEEQVKVDELKKEENLSDVVSDRTKRNKRGPSGPNPLSCRKKKSKPIIQIKSDSNRKRKKKKKIPRHVRQLLKEDLSTI